ncbi:EF-P lysine aminoacylase EpmA [Marinomonas sp. 15G1-11]|uniref:EF-P lysine aminoacylase EpmA n=1 Tax=Marinomonas phaeophyticola TaxID=3004091 RepID=A0ABT4JR61_9GAMM|nr:EF-P lysine aminoacylase EpmA [Marinomonas sp. 15G1-11]MCZ2720847.1 EF-P lysine aminoacylase EpmA [Marinomonas sp. 15G1-11]
MYQKSNWQPSAEIATLKKRAQLFSEIRQFFYERDVMEVDTQILSLGSISDPHIEALSLHTSVQGEPVNYYLQTSPEFAMKRLLCAGSGSIYQLGKVFRAEDRSRRHAVEFTMLEWYRQDFDHWQLMDEIESLLKALTKDVSITCESKSYQEVFEEVLQINPHQVQLNQLQTMAYEYTEYGLEETDRDTLLELLFSHVIETKIGLERPCFIHGYPASQAALAKKILVEGVEVAARFELYWKGMELANGYYELTDAMEQSTRFLEDIEQRRLLNLPSRQVDDRLVAALEHGLPSCAGVALGVDRLLMLLCNIETINQVIPFADDRA